MQGCSGLLIFFSIAVYKSCSRCRQVELGELEGFREALIECCMTSLITNIKPDYLNEQVSSFTARSTEVIQLMHLVNDMIASRLHVAI